MDSEASWVSGGRTSTNSCYERSKHVKIKRRHATGVEPCFTEPMPLMARARIGLHLRFCNQTCLHPTRASYDMISGEQRSTIAMSRGIQRLNSSVDTLFVQTATKPPRGRPSRSVLCLTRNRKHWPRVACLPAPVDDTSRSSFIGLLQIGAGLTDASGSTLQN